MSTNIIKKNINSSRGQISIAVHYPEVKTEKLAILCPGYLDSKDYDHLVQLATVLVERGFAVVRFDPTGTWESEGNISEYTTTQYLEDIKSVKEYMLKDKNYTFILLGGHSMGGRMSLLYAPTDSEILSVFAIMSGYKKAPSKNEEKWKTDGVQINNRDIPKNKNEKRQYTVPFSFLEDSNKYNVLDTIGNLHIPVLLIAGEQDTLCTPEVMKTIFDKANQPKEFVIIPGIGHDYRQNSEQIKIVNDVFLSKINYGNTL